MGKLPWGGIDWRMAAEDACIQKPGLMDTTGRRRPGREAETAERRYGLQYKCLAGLRQGHGSGCRHENRTEDGRRFRGPRKDVERDLSRLCKLVPRRCARRAFSGGHHFQGRKPHAAAASMRSNSVICALCPCRSRGHKVVLREQCYSFLDRRFAGLRPLGKVLGVVAPPGWLNKELRQMNTQRFGEPIASALTQHESNLLRARAAWIGVKAVARIVRGKCATSRSRTTS